MSPALPDPQHHPFPAGRSIAHRAIEHLGVPAAYFVMALVLTYPVVLTARHAIPMDPQIEGWFPGDGDPWHYLWGIWYVAKAFSTFPPPLLWTDLVFFPMGFEIPFLPGVGLILGPGALLQAVFGLVLSYNLLWWLSFALAGYAMYLLVRHLLGDRVVAFAGGCLFAFSSYRLIHSVEHLPIVMASFLVPAFALALLRAGAQPTGRRHAACALVLAASAGISWYCTVTLLVYAGTAALLLVRRHGLRAPRALRVVPLLISGAVFVVAVSPFVLPLIVSPARDSIVNRPLAESSAYSADLLAFFVPSPRNPVFGGLTGGLYARFTGNPYEQTVYLGYVLLALALVGVRSAARTTTRLFRVSAVTAFVLALGPVLHVAGVSRLDVDGEVLTVPLPYLLLRYVPFVKGARVPSRFAELLLMSLIVLAAYGLARVCARLGTRGRAAVAALVVAGALLETTLLPFPVVSARVPAVYAEIGRSAETGTLLELPLDVRIIKYHYNQTIHGQRMVGGNPVRPRQKYANYPDGMPLITLLKEPKRLLDAPDPEHARRDAERLAAFFDVRHIVIHGEYLEARVLERLDRFVADNFPHAWRKVDGPVVAYGLRRPDPRLWPERYVIDFGDPGRDFALMSGWWSDERWNQAGPTIQWANDRESALTIALGAPETRRLEFRVHPMLYPGAPPQTVALDVNGTPRGSFVLKPDWDVYRITLPATAFRPGLNTLTFRYGYTAAPAAVTPGSRDIRTLAVAFDTLTLTPVRSDP